MILYWTNSSLASFITAGVIFYFARTYRPLETGARRVLNFVGVFMLALSLLTVTGVLKWRMEYNEHTVKQIRIF
jgi:uncharacterized membrane protein (Fun14 family)